MYGKGYLALSKTGLSTIDMNLLETLYHMTMGFYERFNFKPSIEEQIHYLTLEEDELREVYSGKPIHKHRLVEELADVMVVYSVIVFHHQSSYLRDVVEPLINSAFAYAHQHFDYAELYGMILFKAYQNMLKTPETHQLMYITADKKRGIIRNEKQEQFQMFNQ